MASPRDGEKMPHKVMDYLRKHENAVGRAVATLVVVAPLAYVLGDALVESHQARSVASQLNGDMARDGFAGSAVEDTSVNRNTHRALANVQASPTCKLPGVVIEYTADGDAAKDVTRYRATYYRNPQLTSNAYLIAPGVWGSSRELSGVPVAVDFTDRDSLALALPTGVSCEDLATNLALQEGVAQFTPPNPALDKLRQ